MLLFVSWKGLCYIASLSLMSCFEMVLLISSSHQSHSCQMLIPTCRNSFLYDTLLDHTFCTYPRFLSEWLLYLSYVYLSSVLPYPTNIIWVSYVLRLIYTIPVHFTSPFVSRASYMLPVLIVMSHLTVLLFWEGVVQVTYHTLPVHCFSLFVDRLSVFTSLNKLGKPIVSGTSVVVLNERFCINCYALWHLLCKVHHMRQYLKALYLFKSVWKGFTTMWHRPHLFLLFLVCLRRCCRHDASMKNIERNFVKT